MEELIAGANAAESHASTTTDATQGNGDEATQNTSGDTSRDGAERMTYNPSLGVVAAEAGDAVRLPKRRQAPTR